VALAGMAVVRRMKAPLLDASFHLPPQGRIDRRLVVGSTLFGICWGMAGFCPGPAVASLSMGLGQTVLFVAFMLVGMVLHDRFFADAVARPTAG